MTGRTRDPARNSVDSPTWKRCLLRLLRKPPTARIFNVDELIQLVVQRAAISPAQAELAVSAVLSYLTARLPSPVVGRIREQLGEAQAPRNPDGGNGGVK